MKDLLLEKCQNREEKFLSHLSLTISTHVQAILYLDVFVLIPSGKTPRGIFERREQIGPIFTWLHSSSAMSVRLKLSASRWKRDNPSLPSTGRKQLKRAVYLKEDIIECSEVEAVASSHLPGLLRELNVCCCETMVLLVYLIACFQEKSDMETCWIWQHLISKGARVTQNKRETIPIGHDGYCILFSVQGLEIEAILEEGACFGEIVYTEIEVVELHEVRWNGALCWRTSIGPRQVSRRTSSADLPRSEQYCAGQLPSQYEGDRATCRSCLFDDDIVTHQCLLINCSRPVRKWLL